MERNETKERYETKERMEKIENKKKRIWFKQIVDVILIPCIRDMDDEMRSKLWWNKMDYMQFYIASKAEIEFFLKLHDDLKYNDAVRLLYQHSMICYEPYMM